MSTRSLIGKKYADGSVKFIYCHNDGYPEGVGAVLNYNYNESNIEQLLALGDLSVLGNKPVSNDSYWKTFKYNPNKCVTYASRGECTPATKVDSTKEFIESEYCQDYLYLLTVDGWYISKAWEIEFIPLKDIIN